LTDLYAFWVSLLNGDGTVTGSGGNDPFLEVGSGGTATVNAGTGNDVLYIWNPKNVTYGGSGSGTLIFQSFLGPPATEPIAGAAVNLKTGVGTNPWTGTLEILSGVNNLVGTDKADSFVGNDKGDVFGDGVFDLGADTIQGGAGNDTVNLAEGASYQTGGVHADGGGGINTLSINIHSSDITGPHELDLLDQSKNSGIFQNDVLTNFQVFVHGTGFFAQAGQAFVFIDNNQSNHTVEAIGQTNTITFHGGNDTLVLYDTVASGYTVQATGVGGRNTLDLGDRLLDGKNTFDFVNQSKNTGVFAHVTFAKVGAITGAHLVTAPTDGELVVIGGQGPESITGTYKGDLLRAGSGNDVINGGGGNDSEFGGPGHDVFVFDSSLRPREHTVHIFNFAVSRDKIELDKTIFIGVGHNGVLAASHFDTGAHAHHASDRIIYDPGTGGLFYHAPGTPLSHGVEFAILAKHLLLTHADFFVV
jgi:Ca2+-binding RTX toxin-like protein